ncbi:MAG: PIN domain-containing protein [Syntrophales bacterium]|nr:PIN domain-containing protein [Syntrophales bacterium]
MSPLTESGDSVYLLDTSALLTFIEDEDGSGRVEEVLRREGTLLPWPVLMETYYISLREEGRAEADRRYALIRHLEAKILWDMNEQILLIAARLKAEHHVSLADAIVAAYAIQHKAVLIHKDPEFEALVGLLPMEALPYKSK